MVNATNEQNWLAKMLLHLVLDSNLNKSIVAEYSVSFSLT